VIAFIGIMAAIALPAYQQYKMRAKAMQQQVQLEPMQK
jgi:Tfp pilus assembly protein PilE